MQEGWARANHCFNAGIFTAVGTTVRFEQMNDADYESYVDSAARLNDAQKAALKLVSREDRSKRFEFAVDASRYDEFWTMLQEFQALILKNSLFMQADFEPLLRELEALTRMTLVDFEMRTRGDTSVGFKSVSELGTKGRPILEQLKGLLHRRLWSPTMIEPTGETARQTDAVAPEDVLLRARRQVSAHVARHVDRRS